MQSVIGGTVFYYFSLWYDEVENDWKIESSLGIKA